ncbi:MAG: UDP-N-acetylmuramoyl-L-alanyl-D-glutamate--2,6-diaminopimelate ligase [Oscillospiraceae bacterium]|nr:UDP-N-acetylmuramoyl-L-alanyl-D-glutamate--2,6-diaminopimelate ligase [Oscillospiraceae bacterium]
MTIKQFGFPIKYANVSLDNYVGRLCIDSREIRAGDTFIAQKGLTVDGHSFAAKAVQAGAAFVIAQKPLDEDIPHVVFDPFPTLAEMAARYYDYPSKKMKMVGVTGTNGKTTVTHILYEMTARLGYKCGLIGTNRVIIGTDELSAERTTPDAQRLQETLDKMVRADCEYCFMEVSSHALDMGRVEGIQYNMAIFTNLSQDHLDFHNTMEEYYLAKRKLFDMCDLAVVNTADPYGARLFDEISTDKIPIETVSGIEFNSDCVRFKIKNSFVTWRTPGKFSVDNAAAALTCGKALGFSVNDMAGVFENIPPVKGRMEPVKYKDGITVLIDYAHSPDALKNVLLSAREFTEGRLICVMGCGGNRDKEKRPVMGATATEISDYTVVTSDNPRFEEPDAIIKDITPGCKGEYTAITDRRNAIAHALSYAKSGDVVLLCGKGHETYQEIAGHKYHMDEREIVRECVTKH